MPENTEPDARQVKAYYVYCVAEEAAAQFGSEPLPEAIEDGSALEWVSAVGLSALTSQVPLETYNETGLTAHLSDAAWTAVRAMRHERVVEYFAKRSSVVPLRFGAIYLEPRGIQRMLSDRTDELKAIIERLREREEWGVNVFVDQSVLKEAITRISPRLRELADTADKTSPGQSYLIRKKIEALRVDEVRAEVVRLVDQMEQSLRQHTVDTKRLRVLKVEATEHGELKGKFAFLIERKQFPEFRSVAEELAQENQAAGVRLELTGPWPAYNFAVTSPGEEK